MNDIFINLDVRYFAPQAERTLLDMVTGYDWPEGATCATQDSCGAITWWNADINQVAEARGSHPIDQDLVAAIGIGQQVHEDYFFDSDEQNYTASDWRTSVVTYENYEKSTKEFSE